MKNGNELRCLESEDDYPFVTYTEDPLEDLRRYVEEDEQGTDTTDDDDSDSKTD